MIKKFLRLPIGKKCILVKALIFTGMCRVIILSLPFKIYKGLLGESNEESEWREFNSEIYYKISTVKWAVITVSKYTPWKSECLVKSMTCKLLLKRYKISSTIYLGVNKSAESNLSAHSCIRCGNLFLTGGDGSGYGIVGRFSTMFDEID